MGAARRAHVRAGARFGPQAGHTRILVATDKDASMIKWALMVLAFTTSLVFGASVAGAQTYLLGVVPQFDARVTEQIWSPIIAEIKARTGIELQLVGSPSIPEFEKAFQTGAYDIAYMNPYHYIMANRAQGYLPILRDGGAQLSGVLVVAKDGPIKGIADLQGKTIAFPAPNALGASLLMRAELTDKAHLTFTPIYVKDHTSAYLNAALGVTAAAGGVMATLDHADPDLKAKLRVIYTTASVAPHPVVVHPRVPEADRKTLQEAFLAMAATPEGAAMLDKIPMLKAVAAQDADYQPLREMGLDKFYEPGK